MKELQTEPKKLLSVSVDRQRQSAGSHAHFEVLSRNLMFKTLVKVSGEEGTGGETEK